jgi:serine/threonine-protein kinase
MAHDDERTQINEPDRWVTPEDGSIERVEVERTGPPPPPGSDVEEAVVHERQTVRQREDGAIETETVRHEQRRRSTGAIVGIVLVVLALLAAGAAVWYFTEGSQTTVPSLEGRTVDDALARLDEADLDSDVVTEQSDEPEGRVFAQSPGAGTEVDEGSTVTIRVSSGTGTTAVPNAVGLGEAEARDRLVGAGFEVETEEVFSDREAGTVVSQSPAAGAQAADGDTVTIQVSKGTGQVDVPNVVGLSRGEAQAQLSQVQLEANLVEVPSDEAVGTVVAQNPIGGAQAQQGSTVRLNVSAGR